MATTSGDMDARQTGTFLRGWGGLIAVLLGIGIAGLLTPVIRWLVELLYRAMTGLGLTADGAVLAIYWLGMIAIGAGFVVAFLGPEERMSALRVGVGDWMTVLEESLIAACAAGLWFFAAQTWLLYGDEFNTYGNATELSAVGVMVAIIAGAVLGRWLRHRHASHGHPAH